MGTKAAIGLVVLICLFSGLARSDTIGLYADPSGTNCNIYATTPFVLTNVYVVHVAPLGTSGSAFSAPTPACWAGRSGSGIKTRFALSDAATRRPERWSDTVTVLWEAFSFRQSCI